MEVYLYNNTKRLNSTKLPGTAATTLDCTFKESTSILSPVLVIYATSKPTENYMKFDNRYYWITDIISLNNNRWELHGSVDVLATFRSHILNTSAFVLFDSTPNTQIPDTRLATKTDCEAHTDSASMPWSFSETGGTYLIAVTGCKDSFSWNDGAYSYSTDTRDSTGVYIIPKSSIDQLGYDVGDLTTDLESFYNDYFRDTGAHSALLNPALASDFFEYIGNCVSGCGQMITDLGAYTLKFWKIIAENLIGGGTALQNIKASYWLPFDLPSSCYAGTTGKPLALGTYKDYVSGLHKITDPIITSLWIDVSIPWQFTDWRNVTCTEVMLYIPMIGCINIPSDVIKGNDTLQVRIALNVYSGAMSAEVRCDGGTLGTYGANVSMPYLIGDSNANIASITNTVTSAATQNYIGAVSNAISSFNAMATSVGGIGGGAGAGLTSNIVCICRTHDTSQEPSALLSTIGTPTNQLKTLATGLGYVQTMKAQLNCANITGEPYPTQTEISTINNALDSGVYLE